MHGQQNIKIWDYESCPNWLSFLQFVPLPRLDVIVKFRKASVDS